MEYEVFYKYPDYLQNFEIIQTLADLQWVYIRSFSSKSESMLRGLHPKGYSSDRWYELYPASTNFETVENMRIFLKRHVAVDITTLKEYIGCWLTTRVYDLTYDSDTMTLTLTVKKSGYHESDNYRKIRNVIPCNMELVVELTE